MSATESSGRPLALVTGASSSWCRASANERRNVFDAL